MLGHRLSDRSTDRVRELVEHALLGVDLLVDGVLEGRVLMIHVVCVCLCVFY